LFIEQVYGKLGKNRGKIEKGCGVKENRIIKINF